MISDVGDPATVNGPGRRAMIRVQGQSAIADRDDNRHVPFLEE